MRTALAAAVLIAATPALAQTPLAGAQTLIDTGRYAEAKALADEALKGQLSDADKSAALLVRGEALAAQGDCKTAVPDLEQARQLYPGSDVHGDLGDCYFALGNYPAAIDHLQQDMRRNPSNISRVRIAQSMIKLGRLDEAREMLRSALTVDPNDADAAKAMAELQAAKP